MAQHKILAAMYALGNFTVRRLVAETGENPSTVYTVMQRYDSFIENLGATGEKKRGGQEKLYRVKEACVNELKKIIRSDHDEIDALLNSQPEPSSDQLSGCAKEIQLAEDLLALPSAEPRRKESALRSAAQSLEIALESLRGIDSPVAISLIARIDAIEKLRSLVAVEEAARVGAENVADQLFKLKEAIGHLSASALAAVCRRLIGVIEDIEKNRAPVPAEPWQDDIDAAALKIGPFQLPITMLHWADELFLRRQYSENLASPPPSRYLTERAAV